MFLVRCRFPAGRRQGIALISVARGNDTVLENLTRSFLGSGQWIVMAIIHQAGEPTKSPDPYPFVDIQEVVLSCGHALCGNNAPGMKSATLDPLSVPDHGMRRDDRGDQSKCESFILESGVTTPAPARCRPAAPVRGTFAATARPGVGGPVPTPGIRVSGRSGPCSGSGPADRPDSW